MNRAALYMAARATRPEVGQGEGKKARDVQIEA
jgi:hypothetical protein